MKRLAAGLTAVFLLVSVGSGDYAAENYSGITPVQEKVQTSALSGSGYVCAAENEHYRLLADAERASIALENVDTGYIWYSSPPDAENDPLAADVAVSELCSSNTLRYGIPERRSANNYLRSASEECSVTVSAIENGVRIFYDYSDAGISFPVDYVLEEDYLKASLKTSDIIESRPENKALDITIMGSFGAAGSDEEGYFVIPDGCGALMRFNNGRSQEKNLYSRRVYGSDVTFVPEKSPAVEEQIYLPVYGISKGDNAMLVTASGGDSNAVLTANTSVQSGSSYNLCCFTFILRSTDTFYMTGSGSGEQLTAFEGGDIKSDDIELRYYPISGSGLDYTDIAARYRQYLIEEEGVEKKAQENQMPLILNLYCGTEKKHAVLGIPVNTKTSFTSFKQATEIFEQLKQRGVEKMGVTLRGWTDDGIEGHVDEKAVPATVLGGEADFENMTGYASENGIGLYPVSESMAFVPGSGYHKFSGTAVRVSGSYSRIYGYDPSTGKADETGRVRSLLSPSLISDVLDETAESYNGRGLDGICIGSLTTALYGDYGKNGMSRGRTMNSITEACADMNKTLEAGIFADGANAYMLPYVSFVGGVPLNSGRYDCFDEDIPFYQLVLHGLIPYSTKAVNGSADSETLLLMAAATGSCLSFDMMYEGTDKIKDTDFDTLYYADYSGWLDTAEAEYKLISEILSGVSGCTIDEYTVTGNVITAVYSNGTVVVTDLDKKIISCNGKEYSKPA